VPLNSSSKNKVPVSKEGLQRLRNGHPWLYEDQIQGAPFSRLAEAALVPLGEHWFFYSPASKLRLRRLGPTERFWPHGEKFPREICSTPEEFAEHFAPAVRELMKQSFLIKKRHLPEKSECFRWIFAENDFIPGLLVEAYGPTLVAQIQSAPVEKFWPVLKKILLEVFQEHSPYKSEQIRIIEQRHLPVRKLEGLEVIENPLADNLQELQWNGFTWKINPGGSQKTGSYLDQAPNHRKCADYARKIKAQTAWDLCSFEGGFSLHLLNEGLSVLAVDQSASALSRLQENVELNKLPLEKLKTQQEDIFDFLKRAHQESLKADLISLDPPAFVKHSKDKERALRAFKELNLRALHCLNAGGILVSCSCSHHISIDDYRKMLKAAAHDARKPVRVLEVAGPAEDHGPLLGFSESEYLQAWFLELAL
jgi:23S rRNA (cytosine1962-C5)-methyltransferase